MPTPKKIWEAIQTLFASMNEIQELVAVIPNLQFVYAVLVLIAKGSGLRMLMAVPNREVEPKNV